HRRPPALRTPALTVANALLDVEPDNAADITVRTSAGQTVTASETVTLDANNSVINFQSVGGSQSLTAGQGFTAIAEADAVVNLQAQAAQLLGVTTGNLVIDSDNSLVPVTTAGTQTVNAHARPLNHDATAGGDRT